MNVLIAASYKARRGGNFISSLLELSLSVKSQGGNVIFIFPESENAKLENSWCDWLKNHGLTVYLVDKEASPAKQLDELRQIINKHNIHILHTHFGIYGKVLKRFRRKLPVKIIVHDHFGFPLNKKLRIKQKLRNAFLSVLYRLLDINVAAVNKEKGDSFLFSRAWYVPNGLSSIRNVELSRSRYETRALLNISEGQKACLILGWDFDRKGMDIAVKAIAECRMEFPELLLCVVGFGSAPTEKLITYISENTDIDPNSHWIRYWDDTEDIFSYHRAVDVYLSASRSEGFPYGILEAISQNTPVVLSDIKETVWAQSYDHAFTYSVENPLACAECIKKALEVGRSPSNYEAAVAQYSITSWCQQMLSIYQEV